MDPSTAITVVLEDAMQCTALALANGGPQESLELYIIQKLEDWLLVLYGALHPVQARANGGTLPRVQKARVIVELHLGWMLRLLYLVRSLPPLSHERECLLARSRPHDAIMGLVSYAMIPN